MNKWKIVAIVKEIAVVVGKIVIVHVQDQDLRLWKWKGNHKTKGPNYQANQEWNKKKHIKAI